MNIFLLTFFLPVFIFITSLYSKKGTDSYGHIHFIQSIKNNGHKLFVEFPRLINKAPLAYPLFLHWVLSFFPIKYIEIINIIINPIFKTLEIIVFYFFLSEIINFYAIEYINPLLVTIILALTPHYYHLSNARNYGLSARTIGHFLFVVLCYVTFLIKIGQYPLFPLATAGIFICYIIWGSSLFAQQTLITISVIMGLFWGEWLLFILCTTSWIIFLFLHKSFSIPYFKDLFKYYQIYSKYLAKIFILKNRFSIWRDIFYDIPVKIKKSIKDGVNYSYNNSIIIILFFNPLVLVSVVCLFDKTFLSLIDSEFFYFSIKLTISGICIFLLTSFRLTRFFGEPERYIEMITPFSNYVGITFFLWAGYSPYLIIAYFLFINIIQIYFGYKVVGKMNLSKLNVDGIKSIINKDAGTENIRFISNNFSWTKQLFNQKWKFLYYYPTTEKLGKYSIEDFTTVFPYIFLKYVIELVKEYRINYILYDKNGIDNNISLSLDNYVCIYEDSSCSIIKVK